jgi:hypothetical protein
MFYWKIQIIFEKVSKFWHNWEKKWLFFSQNICTWIQFKKSILKVKMIIFGKNPCSNQISQKNWIRWHIYSITDIYTNCQYICYFTL